MKRIAVVATLVTICASVAHAQTTNLTVSTSIATPGDAVTATVTGPPGQNYALISSTVGSGFSYAGVSLAVGTDVAILAVGVLDGTGRAVASVTPPFRGATLTRYYLQAVTSASPAFTPLAASPSVIVRNSDVTAPLPLAILVNPDGSVQYASPGLTVARTAPGTYRVTIAAGSISLPFLPSVNVVGTQVMLAEFFTASAVDLTFSGDALFHLTIHQVR